MSTKKVLRIVERQYGKNRFLVLYGKEKLYEGRTKEHANDFASMYFVPPYTMQTNVWY